MYFPIDDGIEVLYGDVKQAIIEEDSQYKTEQSYYAVINLNKRTDSIEVEYLRHGALYDTRYTTVYDSKFKKIKLIGHFNYQKLRSSIEKNDSTDKKRLDSLSKQVSEIYKYDKNGYIINRSFPSKKLSDESCTYKYNSVGDMIECDFCINPKLLMDVTKLIYDKKHMIVEEKSFHNGRLMFHANYSYLSFDSENNWTKRKVFYDGNAITLTRKITYY